MGSSREYYRQHYKDNPEYYSEYRRVNRAKILASASRIRVEKKLKAIEYLGGKCKDCGGEFHYCQFDFHHRDPTEKDFNIGDIRGKRWEFILTELDKCDLLCSNCHRLRHFN